MASPTWQQRFQGVTFPSVLLYLAIKSYLLTLVDTLLHRRRRLSEVRDDAFAQFWDWINPPPDPNQPLEGSATLIPPLLATAEGAVLEIGPGSGAQVRYFRPASKIKKIYGAEPCVPLHKALLANARDSGLGDKYAIVNAGAEKETLIPGLAKAGLLEKAIDGEGIFDTIVCVRVLCSVINPQETGDTLYRLLKPGGKLLVCEHIENPYWTAKGSYLARVMQTVYLLLGWTFFVGNCHLTRNSGQILVDAAKPYGGWDDVDLTTSFTWTCIPYASGTLVKRRDRDTTQH